MDEDKTRPMFVMSMFANKTALLEAKCAWLEEENERLEGLLLEVDATVPCEPLLELDEDGYEVVDPSAIYNNIPDE